MGASRGGGRSVRPGGRSAPSRPVGPRRTRAFPLFRRRPGAGSQSCGSGRSRSCGRSRSRRRRLGRLLQGWCCRWSFCCRFGSAAGADRRGPRGGKGRERRVPGTSFGQGPGQSGRPRRPARAPRFEDVGGLRCPPGSLCARSVRARRLISSPLGKRSGRTYRARSRTPTRLGSRCRARPAGGAVAGGRLLGQSVG